MSYFDDASLVMIPSGYKDQKVYSVKPIDGSGDLTFTRSNDTATRVGPDGLIEKVRTNVLTYSNDTNNADWSRVGATSTSGQSGYDGSSDAWLFSATGGGSHYALQSKTDTGILTFSIYAKQGTSKGIRIAINGGGDHWANFNLDLGTQIGTAASVIDTEITSVGGGWYRISVTANKTTTFGWGVVYILDSSFATAFTAAGETIYIQDAQLESGDIATDYIATTTAAVSVGPVANLPRLDYLGSSCPRLLLEPQRTNSLTYSEQFDNAAWTKAADVTLAANYGTSPDGYQNADRVVATAATGGHIVFRAISTTGTHTISIFAKASGYNYTFLGYDGGNLNYGIVFNLSNGTISQNPAGLTGTIEAVGSDGWYRCTLTYNYATAAYFVVAPHDNSGAYNWTGNGTDGILIWGAQAEFNSAYASSYVNTLGAAVTRGADDCIKTGIPSLVSTTGTLFIDFVWNGVSDVVADNQIFGQDPQYYGTTNISISNYGGNLYGRITDGLTLIVNLNASVLLAAGVRYKVAFAFQDDDIVLYVNGTLRGLATSGTIPATSSVYFNNNHPNNKSVNQALVFKTRLSNADLAALTA